MEPTQAQLRQLHNLIQTNWQKRGLLYDFTPDPDSVYARCYLAVFGTPINPSEWQLSKAYYLYPDGSFLDEDDISEGGNNE